MSRIARYKQTICWLKKRGFEGLRYTVLMLLLVVSSEIYAAENNIIPALTVKEEFNDNIYFSVSSPISAYMTVFSPDLDLVSNSETVRILLNAGLDAFIYLDDKQGQTTALNHSCRGQFSIKPTPRLDLGSSLAYRVSNQPDQTLEQNSVVLNSTRRSRQSYAADVGYDFSELASGKLNYAHVRDEYNNPALIDTTQHSAGLRVSYDLSRWLPPAQAIVEVDGAYYTNMNGWTRNLSASAGCNWRFSEIFSATGLFGGSYTQSEYNSTETVPAIPPVTRQVTTLSHGTGMVGNLILTRTGELTQANLKISHDVTVSAGRSGPTETTVASADISYQMTADLSLRASTSYQWDQASFSQSSGGDFTQETMQFSTGLRYKFSEDMNLNANYAYTSLVNRKNGIEVGRNVIFVGFTWRYPLFER